MDVLGVIISYAPSIRSALATALTCRGAYAKFEQLLDLFRVGIAELGWMTRDSLTSWYDDMRFGRAPRRLSHTDAIISAEHTIRSLRWCSYCHMRADDHICDDDQYWEHPLRLEMKQIE